MEKLLDTAISGLIGAFVGSGAALFGQWLSNRHQRKIVNEDWKRTRKQKRFEEIESLYLDSIASFEKAIRCTQERHDYSDLADELPRLNARLQLGSTVQINEQAEVASNLLFQWSSEYRQGVPKKIGDSGFSIMGTPDFPHQERAKTLFPSLCQEIIKLTNLMKEHLKSIEV